MVGIKQAPVTEQAPAKLPPAEFAVKAIEMLRVDNKPNKKGKVSKGIHVVFTGFNEAVRQYYGVEDVRAWTDALVKQGVIESHPCYRGAMIYLKGECPSSPALEKMGL